MRTVIRNGISFSLLFALCVSFVACDAGGSASGPPPEWAGKWKVETFEDGSPVDPEYWDLSAERLRIANQDGEECVLTKLPVIERDGNVARFELRQNGDTFKLRFEVSGDSLTAEALDSDQEGSIGNKITYSRVDEIPILDECK